DGQLRALDSEVNNKLLAGASEISRLAGEVARINGEIGSDASKAAPDLLDRRDQLVAELVGVTGGTALSQDRGPISVFPAGVQASSITTVPDPYRPERLQLALQGGGTTTVLDQRALGGSMGGLVEFRNTVLDPAAAELGRIAVAMAATFNEGHAAGMNLYGN